MLINDSSKLRKHYVATGRWKTDVLSLLPTDIAYYWWPPHSCWAKVPCPVIVRVNRLFKVPRMGEFFDRTETGTGYPNAFRICKVRKREILRLINRIVFIFIYPPDSLPFFFSNFRWFLQYWCSFTGTPVFILRLVMLSVSGVTIGCTIQGEKKIALYLDSIFIVFIGLR